MSSISPISGDAMSALIFELDPNAPLGSNPFGPGVAPPFIPATVATRKISSVLETLRDKIIPRVWQSANTTQITVIYRTRLGDVSDPFKEDWVEGRLDVYAVVSGPTAESLEKGLLVESDLEVLIPAYYLTTPLGRNDAIEIGSSAYAIVGHKEHPNTPPAVAYRYMIKKAVA